MSNKEKKEALLNAIKNLGFSEYYTIKSDEIKGKTFALAKKKIDISSWGETYESIQPQSDFMPYEVLNAYLLGYFKGAQNAHK